MKSGYSHFLNMTIPPFFFFCWIWNILLEFQNSREKVGTVWSEVLMSFFGVSTADCADWYHTFPCFCNSLFSFLSHSDERHLSSESTAIHLLYVCLFFLLQTSGNKQYWFLIKEASEEQLPAPCFVLFYIIILVSQMMAGTLEYCRAVIPSCTSNVLCLVLAGRAL